MTSVTQARPCARPHSGSRPRDAEDIGFRQLVAEALSRLAVITGDLAVDAGATGGEIWGVEEAVDEAMMLVRRELVSLAVTVWSSTRRAFRCRRCEAVLYHHGDRKRTIVTGEGVATYNSHRYRCPSCGETSSPLDEANDLSGSRYTLRARALIAESAADFAFGHVPTRLKERGIEVSPKEVDRVAREVSEMRREEEDAAVAATDNALRTRTFTPVPTLQGWSGWKADLPQLISVDGAKVRSTTQGPDGSDWFEVRAGIIGAVGNRGRVQKYYCGGTHSPDRLFELLQAAAASDPYPGRLRLFIADGAPWIWARVARYFPEAIQVLDLYHASEHVASAAVAAWGEKSPQAIEWRRRAKAMLMGLDGPTLVREALNRVLISGQAADPKALETELNYLKTHADRMDYAELIERGLDIGSGVMESGIKQLSTQRLRGPGMKWVPEGADSMMRLRSAHKTGELRPTVHRRHLRIFRGTMDQQVDKRAA